MQSPLTSPWSLDLADDTGTLEARVNFNNSTHAVQSAQVTRSAGYQYTTAVFTRTDGSTFTFSIPVGTTTVGKSALNNAGFNVIEDIIGFTLMA
jgi:hypothetical protein